MYITLTRYYESPEETKGELLVDGRPFGETREPGTDYTTNTRGKRRLARIAEADYDCHITASDLSPMSLKVKRRSGQGKVFFGWDAIASWRTGFICIGQADPFEPPETRELTDREETFERFTQRLYQAYARKETITLEVRRCLVNNLTNQL